VLEEVEVSARHARNLLLGLAILPEDEGGVVV
jgi:hypothetical protein